MTSDVKSIKKHRPYLTGEHRFGDAGQLLIFIIFLVVWITDGFFLRYTTYIDDYIPLAIHLTVGTIVLLLALILSSYGMKIVFGEVQEKPGVIRKGVYGRFRHPIYLGEMLLYLSLIIFKTSLAALSIWIIAVLFLHYLSRFEERLLLERFGDDYRQYMKDVPMYFPRIIKSGEKRKIID